MTFSDLTIAPKEEILKTSVKELGLAISGSLLEGLIQRLHEELLQAGLAFRPEFYITDDWGCIDEAPVIGIPFYLLHPALREIEREKIKVVETDEEIAQTLRHEVGHAFNYVYSLYKLPRWQEVFGKYNRPYRDNFAPIAGSDKFVRHLEGWYAQKHPDEDFAETFAVLLTPAFDWKRFYKGTPAFEKLQYVSDLIKEYKTAPVPTFAKSAELDVPIESLSLTLEEWYQKRAGAQMPSKKILLLFYQEYPKRIPTRDEVVDQIKEILLARPGYSAVLLPINQSIERITQGIRLEKPDLIFNLCETFRNNDLFSVNVTALVEMLQIPFTGSSSGGLFMSSDKHLSKKIFDYHKIPYPNFFLVRRDQEPVIPKNMKFPLFVKPVHEDASIGIDEHSLVKDDYALRQKINEIHKEIRDDALVEEYIDGREFFVTVLGNRMPKPLELLELDFSHLPSGFPRVYTRKAKFEQSAPEFAITPLVAKQITSELKQKIKDLGVRVHQALGAQDYSRVDIRMNAEGKLYVLEANLNPYLARGSETVIAAEAMGLSYQQLISTIIEMALARAGK